MEPGWGGGGDAPVAEGNGRRSRGNAGEELAKVRSGGAKKVLKHLECIANIFYFRNSAFNYMQLNFAASGQAVIGELKECGRVVGTAAADKAQPLAYSGDGAQNGR